MLQRLSRQVITAGKADEIVADGGGPSGENSIFTGYLLEGLRGAAVDANGVLTANDLMHYVYRKVAQDNRSQQTPQYGHIDGDGDFILLTPNQEHLTLGGQQDLLVQTVAEMPEPTPFLEVAVAKPTFAEKNGYGDPEHPSFGRNDWSAKLDEYRYRGDGPRETSKAFSWLSLIIEPVANQSISIDFTEGLEQLFQFAISGDRPYEQFRVPRKTRTTIDSLVRFDQLYDNPERWVRYLRLDKTGNIEYADSRSILGEYNGVRYFQYIQLIGLTWQFMFLAKRLLADAGYTAGVRLLVNLVGTRDSILAGLSEEPGEGNKKWVQPPPSRRASFGQNLLDLKCPSPNLQMEYRIVIGSLDEAKSREVINDVARQLGLAYNHQSPPRCFNYNTDVFPWRQYSKDRRHLE